MKKVIILLIFVSLLVVSTTGCDIFNRDEQPEALISHVKLNYAMTMRFMFSYYLDGERQISDVGGGIAILTRPYLTQSLTHPIPN